MQTNFPSQLPQDGIRTLLLAMADDELVLGHRDSEWTGYAPILEEDIAFSNIAQDEIGHSLVWFTLLTPLTGLTPDQMAFERSYEEFTCCRFVTHPKGDFAYTTVRQYLFDEAERVRLTALSGSSYGPLKEAAAKILREEAYHLMHSKGLVERLGDATEESHRRMQAAVDLAFPQALGMFEPIDGEAELQKTGVFPGNVTLEHEWLNNVVSVLMGASLKLPIQQMNGKLKPQCKPELGGRKKSHTAHLQQLVDDVQLVYRMAPGGKW